MLSGKNTLPYKHLMIPAASSWANSSFAKRSLSGSRQRSLAKTRLPVVSIMCSMLWEGRGSPAGWWQISGNSWRSLTTLGQCDLTWAEVVAELGQLPLPGKELQQWRSQGAAAVVPNCLPVVQGGWKQRWHCTYLIGRLDWGNWGWKLLQRRWSTTYLIGWLEGNTGSQEHDLMCRRWDEQPMLLEEVNPQNWICDICQQKLMNKSE